MSVSSTPNCPRLAIALLCGALVAAAAPAAAQTEAPRGLVADGDAPDYFLLYTGDVIGYLDTCGCKRNPAGGLARRAWVFDRVAELFPDTPRLTVDSGNFSDLPTAEGDVKTRALIEAMGRLGYDAVNVGERDLKTGYADFARRTEGARFPFLSANIVKESTGEPVFRAHHTVELRAADGRVRKVGLIGVARPNPIFLKAGPGDSNLVIVDPLERVRGAVAELERAGVEQIVLLAALHKNDAAQLLEAVPQIDFVVGSYGGVFTNREETAGNGWLLYSGNQGKRVGETRVWLDGSGGVARQATTLHFLTRTYPADQEMLDWVNAVPVGGEGATPASAQ